MTAGSAPSADPPESDALGSYRRRARAFEAEARELGVRSRNVSNLRGLAFGTAVVAGLAATAGGHPGAAPVAILGAFAFLALVVVHARILRREDDALRLARVNLDGLARAEGEFADLSDDGARFVDADHPYSSDLDLFGVGSLYQRLTTAHTHFGQAALARFLTEPASAETVLLRQEAVKALGPRIEERQRLEALSLSIVEPPPGLAEPGKKKKKRAEPPDPEPLLSWAEGAPRISPIRGIVVLAYALPPLTLVAILAARAGAIAPALCLVPLVLSIALVLRTNAEATRVFAAVSSTRGAFLRYGPMFELVESLEVPSALLARLRSGLVGSPVRPSAAMKRFERAVGWFDLRHNGLLHPFANVFLLWDIHSLLRLEAWQRDAGSRARAWFGALGEIEAICSFSALSFEEPRFAWPEVSDGPAHFEADGLVHPLVRADKRVENDVAIRAAGHALLITGSNMSGKSTLLRAMGTSAVLALAGAPVPAGRCRLSRLSVWTSMKIGDSLHRGVSHFYAEVKRLRGVLDATSGPLPVFFLLDEILHGTNSEERQIGARWLLGELLRRGAIGAVSTHDVELCRLPDALSDRVDSLHFRESIDNGVMSFDYRLRPGAVTRGNALHVMRLVGLPVPVDPERDGG